MDRDELATILYTSAEAYAGRRRMRLDPEVQQDLRQLALQAARRMLQENPAMEPRDPLMQHAETAFQQLVDGMAREVRRYRDEDAVEPPMGGDTLRRALRRLCPLFPIC